MSQLADTLAREHTAEAIQTLVDVMRSRTVISDEDGIIEGAKASERIAAAKLILERGHGMPTSTVITLPAQPKAAERLAQMSDADLLAAIGAARLARQRALPAIDTEATDTAEAAELDPLCG